MPEINIDHLRDYFNKPRKTAIEQAHEELTKHNQGASIVPDGKVHRYDASDKPGKKSCWYIFFQLEDMIAGCFGRWDTDTFVKFRSFDYREECAEEFEFKNAAIEHAIAQREAERKRLAAEAAIRAAEIFSSAGPATCGHSYLARKKVEPHGLKLSKSNAAIVPMYDIDGRMTSLQFIAENGDKRFLSGGAVKGSFFKIGPDSDKVYVCEGYASGATVFEQTRQTVYIAFSANNIPDVVKAIRGKFEYAHIVVVADNDETGKKYAKQAADAYGAQVITPPTEGHDINDHWLSGGSVHELIAPRVEPWLINADEFCAQPAPLKWLIKNVIPERGLFMWFGPSGSGKSFAVLDACMHIASGRPDWFGHRVKQAPVVYLAGEGHHGLRARVAVWKQEHRPDRPVDMWLSSSGAKLDNEKSFTKVVNELRQLPVKPALIVVDTVHRFLEGDENSAQDAGDFVQKCTELERLFGCSVLLVHHTGNSEDAKNRARGSSAWRGDLDMEFSIKRSENVLTIKCTKAKDSEELKEFKVNLITRDIVNWIDEDGVQVTSCVIRQDVPDEMARLDAFISDSPGEIVDLVGKFLTRTLNDACKLNKITPYGDGRFVVNGCTNNDD